MFCIRHGGTDADAKCPDASDYNAQYDAESHASYGPVTSCRAQSLCHPHCTSWAGTHLLFYIHTYIKHEVMTSCPKNLKYVFPGQLPGKPYFCKVRFQTKGKCCPSSSSLWSYCCSATAASSQLPYMATKGVSHTSRTSRGTSTVFTPCNSSHQTPTTQCVRLINSIRVLYVPTETIVVMFNLTVNVCVCGFFLIINTFVFVHIHKGLRFLSDSLKKNQTALQSQKTVWKRWSLGSTTLVKQS